MDWANLVNNIYEWVLDIVQAVNTLWNWLITPINIGGLIDIKPLYLVGTVGIVAGVIKAIVA